MADNITARDASGTTRTLATKELSGAVHAAKHVLVNEAGAALAIATEAKQDAILAALATVGTRAYDWANIETVAIASTSAASGAVGAAGEYELSADVDCYFLVGAATPTATTASRFLPAGAVFTLQLSATDMVAVIRKDTDGTLTILPVA